MRVRVPASRWQRLLSLEQQASKARRVETPSAAGASSSGTAILPFPAGTVPADTAAVEDEPSAQEPSLSDNKMQRAQRVRTFNQNRRLGRFGELQARKAGPMEKSAVEMLKITPRTLDDYYKRLCSMDSWRKQENIDDAINLEQLTFIILNFLDHLFWGGEPHGVGEKLVAAMKHFYPELSNKPHLKARLQNGLTGWGKRSPEASHSPLPVSGVFAIIGAMLHQSHFLSACFVLIQFLGYLRPGELQGLTVGQLLPPVASSGASRHWCLLLSPIASANPRPTKSGEYEESVVFDLKEFEWLDWAVFKPLKDRPADSPLIPLSATELLDQWKQAIAALGMDKLEVSRYSMRHSGASWDLLQRNRSISDIKHRGRWASDSSMKRYLKIAKVSDMGQRIGQPVLSYGDRIREIARTLFGGRCQMPAPPPFDR